MGRKSRTASRELSTMHEPRLREFASAILIDTQGRLLFQQRDDVPGIRYPGKVGLFGGHREGNETFLQCVCREVHEEISYEVPPDRFEHMASYSGVDPVAAASSVSSSSPATSRSTS